MPADIIARMGKISAKGRRIEREIAAALAGTKYGVGSKYGRDYVDLKYQTQKQLYDKAGHFVHPVAVGKGAAQRAFRHEGIVDTTSHSVEDLLVAADAAQAGDIALALRVLNIPSPDFETYDFWSNAEMESARNAFRKELGKLLRAAVLKQLRR